jgi:hypothetical protein
LTTDGAAREDFRERYFQAWRAAAP